MGFYNAEPSFNLIRDCMLASLSNQALSNRLPVVPEADSVEPILKTLMSR
jgi:hypothetical protein